MSAFRGRNRKLGDLKSFLNAVEEGRVKSGSVLIVEDIDRLSREDIPEAMPLFLNIVNAGITIFVVRTGREYSRETIAAQPFIVMEALLSMILAHEESLKKCYRSKLWWEGRRAKAKDKKPMTGICPAWLRLDKEAKRL
jgi:DNA invertase Pin-like site-specific DNA recombinase